MSPKTGSTTILAIESAIAGGSLSLIQNGRERANWLGTADVSKGEEILVNIDQLLVSTGTAKREIDLVAVSAGPGSFTGVRIGIATALGLKNGLNVPMASQSAMAAIAATHPDHATATVVIPMGRNAVCMQSFSTLTQIPEALDEPHTIRDADFFDLTAGNARKGSYIVHSALIERITPGPDVIDFGTNVAYAIGLLCARYPDVTTEPLFISKSF